MFALLGILSVLPLNFDLVVSDAQPVLPSCIIYENVDKSNKSINYFEDLKDYAHIQAMVDQEGMSGISLVCATGVFLLYNQEEFDSDDDDEVRLLAGKDTCLDPGSMQSLISVQSYADIMTEQITGFNLERFGGSGIPLKIDEESQYDDNRIMAESPVNSFIVMGKSEWTIITRFRKFCVKPGNAGDYPVCPVSNSSLYFFPEEANWLGVRKGCQGEREVHNLTLQYCIPLGSGNLEPISINRTTDLRTIATEVQVRGGRVQVERAFPQCEDLTDEMVFLIQFRMTHDFLSDYQVYFPLNKSHAWRTEILDYTIDIVNLCADDRLVDPTLLKMVREYYVYFAENRTWAHGKGSPGKLTQRTLTIGHELRKCHSKVLENEVVQQALQETETIISTLTLNADLLKKKSKEKFQRNDKHDQIMHVIWLSINYVAIACGNALKFETNFWMDYMYAANEMYLQDEALKEMWTNSPNTHSIYNTIFAGYGLEWSVNGLSVAITTLSNVFPMDYLSKPVS